MEIGKGFHDTYEENELSGKKAEGEELSSEALEKFDMVLEDDRIENTDSARENTSELTDEEADKKFDRLTGDDQIDRVSADEKTGTQKSPEENGHVLKELNDGQIDELRSRLGWSETQMKKCTVDEQGVYHYRTDRCDLEGKRAENGVLYERKEIELNGVGIEGVFPVFESRFDTDLPAENYKSRAYARECNKDLKNAITDNPQLREGFTPEQLKDIEENRTPTGYVWHHNEEPGKMQLVKREDHDRTTGGAAHTGGNILWGPDSTDHTKERVTF